jgi:hypothetical protein
VDGRLDEVRMEADDREGILDVLLSRPERSAVHVRHIVQPRLEDEKPEEGTSDDGWIEVSRALMLIASSDELEDSVNVAVSSLGRDGGSFGGFDVKMDGLGELDGSEMIADRWVGSESIEDLVVEGDVSLLRGDRKQRDERFGLERRERRIGSNDAVEPGESGRNVVEREEAFDDGGEGRRLYEGLRQGERG